MDNEEAIRTILSALSDALPPVGMATRIEERLHRHALALGVAGSVTLVVPRETSCGRDSIQPFPKQRLLEWPEGATSNHPSQKPGSNLIRSEERRVGKECRSRW